MNKNEWTEIAKTLRTLRNQIEASWPPPGGYMANEPGVNDRRLYQAAQLAAVDRVSQAMACTLGGRSTRFDARRFLELAGVGREPCPTARPAFTLGAVAPS